jgi:hypothetical protein
MAIATPDAAPAPRRQRRARSARRRTSSIRRRTRCIERHYVKEEALRRAQLTSTRARATQATSAPRATRRRLARAGAAARARATPKLTQTHQQLRHKHRCDDRGAKRSLFWVRPACERNRTRPLLEDRLTHPKSRVSRRVSRRHACAHTPKHPGQPRHSHSATATPASRPPKPPPTTQNPPTQTSPSTAAAKTPRQSLHSSAANNTR